MPIRFTLPKPRAAKAKAEEAEAAEKAKIREKRDALLQQMVDSGAIRSVDCRETGATLWAQAGFMLADFETKTNVARLALEHCFSEPRETIPLTIKETVNGKEIGVYTVSHGLEME